MYNDDVIRFLAFAGAVALAFSQPAVTFAEPAPPGGMAMPAPMRAAPMPVYGAPAFHVAPMPVYHPAPRPAPAARPVTANPYLFKVPFDVNTHPGPLHGTITHPPFQPALQPNPLLVPSRLRQWPLFAWPTNFVYGPSPCYSAYGSWGPWGMLATPSVSIGSNTYTAAQQVDPAYGVDIGTLGGVYQQYTSGQPFCGAGFGT